MLTSVFALLPMTTLAGTVLVPSASVTGTSSSPVFYATNNGTGLAIQALSVGGTALNVTTNRSGAFALLAKNTSTTGGGAIYAYSAGNAINGVSSLVNGIVGVTKAPTVSSAGVLGIDVSSASANQGVKGTSTNGTGVAGVTHNGYGVTGTVPLTLYGGCNSDGPNGKAGVGGFTPNASGVLATSVFFGSAHCTNQAYGTGVTGDATIGLLGQGEIWSDGGPPITPGIGVQAQGAIGALIIGQVSNYSNVPPYPALEIQQNEKGPIVLAYGNGGPVMMLDINGNITISGTLTQNTTPTYCPYGCSTLNSKRQTAATVENVGEASLIFGQAYVHLGTDFSKGLDFSQPYSVFVTPEGDSRGLFVTQKTPRGFTVRENQGGRSTVAFSYRIVAKAAEPRTSHDGTTNKLKKTDTKLADRIIANVRAAARHYKHPTLPKAP